MRGRCYLNPRPGISSIVCHSEVSLNTVNQYFATCAKGVEDLLQRELEWQGIENSKLQTGGVAFTGNIEAAFRVCLWSRVASRILLQLKSFEISNDDELYREVISIDWSEHFEP